MHIREIFATKIEKRIEPVIKVSNLKPATILEELTNLVVTPQWEKHFHRVLEEYTDAFDCEDEREIGVWISGFFGSGKSLLMKMLGILLSGGEVEGDNIHQIFLSRLPATSQVRNDIERFLAICQHKISTSLVGGNLHAIMAIENDPLVQIVFKIFAAERGYTQDWAFAWAIEYQIDNKQRTEAFRERVCELSGMEWEEIVPDSDFYIEHLYQAAAEILPENFSTPEAVQQSVAQTQLSGITPQSFIDRLCRWCKSLDKDGRRRKLLLQLDELGQWIQSGSNPTKRLMEIQALVETASTRGQGRIWVAVTTHGDVQALKENVQQELYAKINQRFDIQCKLSNEDIYKVVRERLLRKTQLANILLGERFRERSNDIIDLGSLQKTRRVYRVPSEENFADLYPYLPWMVDVIPNIVKGIAQAANRSETLTGSNRTMIGVMQGGIIDTNGLLESPVGRLVSLADLYEQLSSDSPVETRTAIQRIQEGVKGATSYTTLVARALYLLGQDQYIPCTLQNVTLAMINSIDANLGEERTKVKTELDRLVAHGYMKQVGDTYVFLSIQQSSFQDKVRHREQDLLNRNFDLALKLKEYEKENVLRFDRVPMKGQLAREKYLKIELDGRVIRNPGEQIVVHVYSPMQYYLDQDLAKDAIIKQRSNQEPNAFFFRMGDARELRHALARAVATKEVADEVLSSGVENDSEKKVAQSAKEKDLPMLEADVRNTLRQAVQEGKIFLRGSSYELLDGANARDKVRNTISYLLFSTIYTRFQDLPHRVENVADAVKAALNDNTAQPDLQALDVYNADGTLNAGSVLLTTLKGLLPLAEDDQSTIRADELLQKVEQPPYGWDGNVVKVGIAVLLHNSQCRLLEKSVYLNNLNSSDVLDALTKARRFKALRVQRVHFEKTEDESLTTTISLLVKNAPNWLPLIYGSLLNKGRGLGIDKSPLFRLAEKAQQRHLELILRNAAERGFFEVSANQGQSQYRATLQILAQHTPQINSLIRESLQLFSISDSPNLTELAKKYDFLNQNNMLTQPDAHEEVVLIACLDSFFRALIAELYADPFFKQQMSESSQSYAIRNTFRSPREISATLSQVGETSLVHYKPEQFEKDVQIYLEWVERTLRYLKLVGITPQRGYYGSRDPELNSIFVPLQIVCEGQSTRTFIDLLEEFPYAVLLGDSGSGKSMITRHLAWNHAAANLLGSRVRESSLLLPGKPVPLRIDLRRLNEVRRQYPHYNFVTYTSEELLRQAGLTISSQMFSLLLERRAMLLLFDGLDEVATLDERRSLVEEIENFAQHYPGNRVLVTSRPVGYDLVRFSDHVFAHAYIQPFDDEQIHQFLEHWYAHGSENSPLSPHDRQELEELYTTLKTNSHLYLLAKNPSMLTIIVALHHYERLPDKRDLIYDYCTDLLLEIWAILKSTDVRWQDMKMTKKDQYACLAHLGFALQERSQENEKSDINVSETAVANVTTMFILREIKLFLESQWLINDEVEQRFEAQRFLEMIQVEAGLIVGRGKDENGQELYGFVHQNFQEYFAAVNVYERYLQQKDLRVLSKFLSEHLYDPHWHEVIFLLFGKLSQKLLTTLLRQILSGDIKYYLNREGDDISQNIFFAGSCLCEELDVEGTLAKEIVDDLSNFALNGISSPQRDQAMKMLSALAETRLYGKLSGERIEEIERRLHQKQSLDLQLPSEQDLPVHHYYVYLEGLTHTAQLGQTLSLTMHIQTIPRDDSQLLLIPVNAPEIGVYLEVPGFYLDGDHLRSLLVVDGYPVDRTLQIQCKPVLSGEQTLRVSLYPGGRALGLKPTILTHSVTVLTPIVFPPIPELLDQRTIPDPYPDMVLFIVLEDLQDTQRLQVYCSCPALRMERVALGQLLLSLADIACLRETVIHYASELCMLAPAEVQQSLHQLGAMIFDQLMPPNHALREIYWKLRSISYSKHTPLSWLIVADEHALLPWELVCPYERQSPSGEIEYDSFLSDCFVISHWVARQGLPLQAEAPLGWLALDHYHQHPQHLPYWHTVLADNTFDETERPVGGYQALQEPGLPYYGLHILRYYDPDQETRITALDMRQNEPTPVQNDAEKMTYERRLDFTRKRPVIGLSFVGEDTSPYPIRGSQSDTRLEAGWCLPFMHAAASALVGARWPVLLDADQLFFRTFYDLIRSGTSLGWAVGAARARVKQAFPTRGDWLAYTYFGHPWCTLYQVQPTQGFTLFEALHHPDDALFIGGESYQFLASYRSEAPLWYSGHLQMQQTVLQGEDISIMVIPLKENNIQTYRLERVQASNDYQRIITLTMPQEETTYPVMIRFQREKKELRTFILHLDIVEK